MIPDGVRDKLRAGLPAALEAVGADLENGPPVGEREVAEFYRLLLKRHKLDEPEPEALALDFICLGEWAIPAFRAAKKWLWIHWRYRRAPTPGDFLVALAAVQDGRAADRAALTELQWKLSTLALKEELQRRFEKWRDTRRSEQTLTQNEGA